MPPKKADKTTNKRARNWSEEEQLALLEIWKEPGIRERVAAIASNKKPLWQDISTLLHDKGYQVRSPEQIHTKIKDLKALHRKLHDLLNTSGGASDAMKSPFWLHLQDLLGGRANVNPPEGSVGGSMVLEANLNAEESSSDMSDDGAAYGVQVDDEEQDGAEEQLQRERDAEGDEGEGGPQAPVEQEQEPVQQPVVANVQQAPKQGKKRQRETKKEQTVNALAKKMKDITAASDKRFAATEKVRNEEVKERREEDKTMMQGIMQIMQQDTAERRRAEDRKADQFQLFMTTMMRFMAPAPAPAPASFAPHQPPPTHLATPYVQPHTHQPMQPQVHHNYTRHRPYAAPQTSQHPSTQQARIYRPTSTAPHTATSPDLQPMPTHTNPPSQAPVEEPNSQYPLGPAPSYPLGPAPSYHNM